MLTRVLIRRVLRPGGEGLGYETSGDNGAWTPAADPLGYASPFAADWEAQRARDTGVAEGAVALPFEPLTFRDFMFYRGHYEAAARGYVRRFRPRLNRVTAGFEAATKRTFPAFGPPRLWDQQPIYYMSNARTFVPSGTPVDAPGFTSALDWELELGFVLQHPLRDATAVEAERAIGGFVVLNDFSARDVQIAEQDSGFGPQKAKHFLSSLSATAVTADEVLARWTTLRASVQVNGREVATPRAADPRWRLGDALAHASAGEQLLPGELFGTGTLVGGSGMEIGVWLRPGDELRLEIEAVGVIKHLIR